MPFVLLNRAVFGHKTTAKLVFSFDSIVWSLVTSKSRVCNDIHIRGQPAAMEGIKKCSEQFIINVLIN